MPPPPDDFLDVDAIAAELDVHPQTIQRYFRDGLLPGRKVGRRWMTTRASLDAWVGGAPAPDPTAAVTAQTAPPLEHKDTP